jgi:Kef-type K+ transport system membrane component KefB
MMVLFFVGSCAVKMLSVGLAGRIAGFRGLDLVNLSLTTNARGGPASIAFNAGIVSSKVYTTLVVAAVLTSQLTGAWLAYVAAARVAAAVRTPNSTYCRCFGVWGRAPLGLANVGTQLRLTETQ